MKTIVAAVPAAMATPSTARVAMEMADELTDSPSKAQLAGAMYKDALRQAVRVDAIERGSESAADASWMTGRL